MPDIFDQINPDKKIAGDIFDQIAPGASAPAQPGQLGAPGASTPGIAEGFSSADLAPSFAASGSGPFFAPKEQVPFGTEGRAPEWLRSAGKSVRALGPWGAAAGAGALAGAVAGEGVGAIPGALGGVAAKGIYDLGTMAGNAGVGLTNWALGTNITPFESFDSKIDRILDRVGLPRPETDAENVVQAMTRGAVDAMAGGPALGSALANASKARSTLNSIGRTLQHAPVSQMIGGAAAGGVAESLPDSIKESDTIGGAAARTVIPMIAGIMAGTAHGVGSWGFGRTPLAPETRMALENALAARTGTDAMVQPWEIRNYVSAVEANSPVSAAVRAALKFENPADALSNRYGFQGATSAFGRVPIPEGYDSVIRNIENAQQANVNGIPGLQMATPEAAKSTGVGAFLNKGMASPQGRARQLDNLQAIARFRDEPVDHPESFLPGNVRGEYGNAAAAESEGLVKPFQESFAQAQQAQAQHSDLLDHLEGKLAQSQVEDAQRAAAAQANADSLAAQLQQQQQALDAARRQYAAERPEAAQQQASVKARDIVNKNRDESAAKYRDLLSQIEGGQEIGTDKLPDAVAAAIKRTRNTLGGRLEPETARILKALEEYGVSIPEEPATGTTKITKTLMPTETGAADYSGASVANFEAQTKGLKPAAGGRVRALAEGENPIETVKTPGGSKPYEVQREVVELDDLIHSMGSKNYPKDLQNLNRDSVAAANQKNVITGSFDPEQLTGRQPTGNTGAPIVGPDNVVEGGNMRTAVLGDILTKPEYAAQREAYIKRLQGMGYDVSGMRNPVEVMRRKTELAPAERLKFAEELNAKTGAERSLTETANRDAMKLDTGLMDLWEKGGIGNENNAEFIRRFAQRTMTPNEFATYFPEGKATNALGDRLNAAFLQRAYNNTKLTDTLTMSPDQRIKSIGRAMQDAAPDMARLRAKIESGEIPATHDIPTALTEAAQFIEDARARGRDPLTELKQVDAFAKPHPMRDALVEMMFNEAGRQVGGARLGEALSDMAQQAAKPADMFGEKMAPNDVLARGKGLLAKPAESEVAASAPSAEPPSMAKVTEEPSATVAASSEPPSPPEAGAVTLEEKPAPRPLTLETATNTIEDLNASIMALKRSSEPGSVRAVKQLEAVRDGLKAQVDSVPEGSPVKAAAKYWAEEHAPAFRHGDARKLSEAGMGGATDKLQAENTIAEFMSQGNTASEAAQFARTGKGNPDFVQSVREHMVGRMAAELKDNFKAGDVQKWLDKNSHLMEPSDFQGIRAEIENYRNALSSGEGAYTKLQGDIEAARQQAGQKVSENTQRIGEQLKGMREDGKAVGGKVKEAGVALKSAQAQADELPSVLLAGGKTADIQKVVSDPMLARRALDAAKTPTQKADLENILNEHFNRRYTTSAEVASTPVSNEVATENLMTSLGKLMQDLKNPDFRESIKILRGEDHLKRLEMIRSAVANEQSRGGMMQGSNVGSATEPKTAASIAAEAVAQTPTGLTGRILRVAKRLAFGNDSVNTPEAHRVVVDMALNPEFTKELLKVNRDVAAGKLREADIKPIARGLLRTAPKLNATSNANTRSQEDQKRSEDR